MSKRASDLLREEMDYLGPVRLSVEQTQQQIVDVVRRLEDAGEITTHARRTGRAVHSVGTAPGWRLQDHPLPLRERVRVRGTGERLSIFRGSPNRTRASSGKHLPVGDMRNRKRLVSRAAATCGMRCLAQPSP